MQDFLLAHRDEISELCRKHHVLRLSVFGSAVRDDFDPLHSDVDLRVSFDREAIPRYADNFFSLQDALVAMLGRKVDMVSSPTIRNPYLRKEIEQTQVMLYAA